MLAAVAVRLDPDDPLAGLQVRDHPDPQPQDGWVRVRLRAASLNHHDLWSLRGVGLTQDRLPMVLGCDGAGVTDDGSEVVVHAVIADEGAAGDGTLDPHRSLLSEIHDGTLAEYVSVPRANLLPKPAELSFEQAACLPTAWLTAYRMLFTRGELTPGSTVLVQGAGGGVATALIALGHTAGLRVWVTSRDPAKRERAQQLGAAAAFETGARLPERVDAVMETVGAPTWEHSLNALRPGGILVTSGATGGADAVVDLRRVFFLQRRIVGSTMGTRSELGRMMQMMVSTGLRPVIDSVLPLTDVASGLRRLATGEVFGKIVVTPPT